MSPLGICAATLPRIVFTGPEGLYSHARGLQHRATTSESGRRTWGYALALLALSRHDGRWRPNTTDGELDTAGDAASTRWNPEYAYDDAAAGGVKCAV